MADFSSYTIEDDRSLVLACSQGDEAARSQFVERFNRLIYKTVASTCQRFGAFTVEIEDMAHHVYEKLLEDECRRLQLWRGLSKLSTYLVMIARNITVDHLRKGGKEIPMEHVPEKPEIREWNVPEEAHEAETERQKRLVALRLAMREIPAKQLTIMNLRLAGKSLREIAQMTGLPQGTVFVLNSRALEKMRTLILSTTETQIDREVGLSEISK